MGAQTIGEVSFIVHSHTVYFIGAADGFMLNSYIYLTTLPIYLSPILYSSPPEDVF